MNDGSAGEIAPLGLVVVGASAGAVEALSAVLPALPANYPLPVAVVVHIPSDKMSILADLFRSKCLMKVSEAEDKEPLTAGAVYFAPPDYHLLIEPNRRLSLSGEEPVHFSRPSIDVLFESAADAIGAGVVGVVLTGANEDGARGLKAIADAGGLALVQHPEESLVATMPLAALAACPAAETLRLTEIATRLVELGSQL